MRERPPGPVRPPGQKAFRPHGGRTTPTPSSPPTHASTPTGGAGGADVILATPAERDRLRQRHGDWLSDHPGGL
ncbi:DUF3885 domain-containing protein [Streptomyces sp. CCNWLW230]|uniref:DUF3885 domain-containing protein n=1 Tax=unclassified Streptomyces TaxID=2593676 RepID=UPI003FD68412